MEGSVQNRDVLVIRDKIRRLNRIVHFVRDYIFMIGEHFFLENCELKKYVVPVESMYTQ
jgi:hypothetical protein